jgi:hypothetical protein
MNQRFLSVGILVLAACARKDAPPPSPPAPQEVTFTATDFAFAGPDSIAPGVTAIRLVNNGTQDHHMIVGQFAEGKTMQDLMAFMQANPMGEPDFVTWRGAAAGIAPQGSNTSIADLTPGRYVAICFLPDPADGKAHVEKGMIRELVVAGTRGAAAAPTTTLEARTSDYKFIMPALTAGTHTIHYINDGPKTHEIQMIKLNEGATTESYMAALAPGATAPPQGVHVGGPGALSPGGDNYWTVTLEPGRYLLVCFVPDPDGTPHAMKGMVQELTIPAS